MPTIMNKVYTRLLYDFDGQLLEADSAPYFGPWARAAEGTEPDVDLGSDMDVLGTLDYEDSGDDEGASEPAADVGGEEGGEEPEGEAPKPEAAADADKGKPAGKKKGKEKEKEKEPAVAADADADKEADKDKEPDKPAAAAPAVDPEPQPQPTPAEPQKTPEELRANLVESIAKNYTFTEEEQELLQTDPAKVLPNMAARLFVDVYEALYYSTLNQVPQIIRSISRTDATVQEKNSAFYSEFPELNDPKLTPGVAQIARIWREQNPKATAEEAIAGIGTAAMAFYGLQRAAPAEPDGPPAEPAPKAKMPSTPAAARVGGAQVEQPPVANDILDTLDFEMPDF